MTTSDDVTPSDGVENDLLRGRAVLHDDANRDARRFSCDKRSNGLDQSVFRLQHGVAPQQGRALGAPLSFNLPLVNDEEDSTVDCEAPRHLIKAVPQRRDSLGALDLYDSTLPVNKCQRKIRGVAPATTKVQGERLVSDTADKGRKHRAQHEMLLQATLMMNCSGLKPPAIEDADHALWRARDDIPAGIFHFLPLQFGPLKNRRKKA